MTRLADLVTIKKGKKPPVTTAVPATNRLPLILTPNLKGKPYSEFCEAFPGQVLSTPEDVLIAWDGTIGVTACGLEGVVGSTLAVLRLKADSGVDPRYLWHFLRTKEKEIQSNPRGSSIPHVNPELLNSFEIPALALDAQMKIVQRLDRIDEITAGLVDQLARLRGLENNLFDTQIGNRTWNSRIQNLAEVQIGPFGSLLHASDYISGGIPVLNPTHIRNGVIVPDPSLSVSIELAASLANYRVKAGDVLLGRRGEMGRAAVVGANLEGAMCGTGSVIVRPKGVDPVWLRSLLASNRMKSYLESTSIGSTLPNLNAQIILNAPAPETSEIEQEHFSEKIAAINSQVELLKLALEKVQSLFNAVQAQV